MRFAGLYNLKRLYFQRGKIDANRGTKRKL